MFVTKFDGRKERFDRNKIIRTCVNAGASKNEASAISEKIERRISNGMNTEDIYSMIISEMDARKSRIFRIREEISRMDPESFEIYVKRILENNGYACEWNSIVN